MKNKPYLLNVLLAAAVAVSLGITMVVRTFIPAAILPVFNIPNLAAISLFVLLVDHYIAPGSTRNYVCIPVFAAITFGLLPLVAGFTGLQEVMKLALGSAIVFTAVTWLFTSMVNRISSGRHNCATPIICALGLYLAVQAFAGIGL